MNTFTLMKSYLLAVWRLLRWACSPAQMPMAWDFLDGAAAADMASSCVQLVLADPVWTTHAGMAKIPHSASDKPLQRPHLVPVPCPAGGLGPVEALTQSQIRLGPPFEAQGVQCSSTALINSLGAHLESWAPRSFLKNLTAPHTAPAPDPERFQNGSVDRR